MNAPNGSAGDDAKVRTPVRELSDRDRVRGTYRAQRKQLGTDKNGKPILGLLLCDKTGQIEARAFEGADKLSGGFDEGDYVRVSGQAKSFQGRLQVHLHCCAVAYTITRLDHQRHRVGPPPGRVAVVGVVIDRSQQRVGPGGRKGGNGHRSGAGQSVIEIGGGLGTSGSLVVMLSFERRARITVPPATRAPTTMYR